MLSRIRERLRPILDRLARHRAGQRPAPVAAGIFVWAGLRTPIDSEDIMTQTKTKLIALTLALIGGGTGTGRAADYVVGAIQIAHPWAPATPEGAKAAPGYLTLTNTGREPDRLISGSFVDAGRVEIVSGGGRATQAIAGGLVIAPGETVTLTPTGPHLMFTGLIGPLERGNTAQSILRFEKAGPIVLEFAIEGAAQKSGGRRGR